MNGHHASGDLIRQRYVQRQECVRAGVRLLNQYLRNFPELIPPRDDVVHLVARDNAFVIDNYFPICVVEVIFKLNLLRPVYFMAHNFSSIPTYWVYFDPRCGELHRKPPSDGWRLSFAAQTRAPSEVSDT
jgi:hypothetical protein